MTPCPVKEVHPRAGIGTERGKGKKIVTGTGRKTKKEIRTEKETGKETEIGTETGKRIRREIGIVTETRIENAITGTATETVIATTETGIEMIMTATGIEIYIVPIDFTIHTPSAYVDICGSIKQAQRT